MKILVTGAGGMLSSDLVPYLASYHDCYGATIEDTDITNIDSISKIVAAYKPQIIINCAAYTQVDKAETERCLALQVNALGVQNLSLICKEQGIILCHISTDYVFDGKKHSPYTPYDAVCPINFYGESKLAGEKFLEWISPNFYIIRTSWLYGAYGNNFVKTILRLANQRRELSIVDSQIGSPTFTGSLSIAIKRIIESGKFGIYHVTDKTDGRLSWYGFAMEIVRLAGLSVKVLPIAQYPLPAKRPAYSVLDTTLTTMAIGVEPVEWNVQLQQYMKI
ncbi:MAG: dTDP-4-dehydrorhamnose reductase [Candidatus Magnetoovum sp. WYHC-5]|nr:dTDP-4-dehydrorhamnose reductase [Candidatus Magnetoovum sp. WYHC-5]